MFIDSDRNIKIGLDTMALPEDDFRWLDAEGIQQHLNRQDRTPSTGADIFAFATTLFEVCFAVQYDVF